MRRLAARISTPGALYARQVYGQKVDDHFHNPRNVGKLDATNEHVGTATRGKASCGDVVRLQAKFNPETHVIEDAKFQAFGCGSAIAAASYATELLIGKSVDEALAITNKEIAAELSLPPVKLHCSMLAEEAIQAAMLDYLKKQPKLKVKKMPKPPQEESASAAH